MASGSAKSLQISKEAEAVEFTASISANARTTISAETAGYEIPTGFLGIQAGFTGETNLEAIPGTLLNSINPRATDTATFIGIRNNASSAASARGISCKIVFVKSSFVDDRRD